MGMFSRLQFLPSHFMLTFEEAFHTGFFEQAKDSIIFSPIITDYGARYIAFSEAENRNPYNMQLLSQELQARAHQWQRGLDKYWADALRDQAGPSGQ